MSTRKKRILFCSEATYLNTGYATYTREILNYLHSTNKYDIAELAAYSTTEDERARHIPWKFFGVIPSANSPEDIKQRYQRSGPAQFGGFSFEKTCLQFMPDVVCDIRDFWMLNFADKSPYRNFFKWAIMPTVDAAPQDMQWIDAYRRADACFTYSDWAGEVLLKQANNKINYLGSAPPSAHDAYRKIDDQDGLKKMFHINPETKIIGTVMRNQRRKLYPDLFEAFRLFLDKVDNPNQYKLYCHTSYPDAGWDIPELLHQYNLKSHVLFTYICRQTRQTFASVFQGPQAISPFTNNRSAVLPNVKEGLEYEQMSQVMNLFDLYVQYANCEGFGLPQVEAAACGVPVMGTDYSAMESVLRQLDGIPIKPKALYKELETGCFRAVPDNELASELFLDFFKKPKSIRKQMGFKCMKNFQEKFRWDISGKKWEDYFDSVDLQDENKTWRSPPNILAPSKKLDEQTAKRMSPLELSSWLIINVLRQPDKIGSYLHHEITQSLIYQVRHMNNIGSFLNEDESILSKQTRAEYRPFSFDAAYNELSQMRNVINHWENIRMETLLK